LLPANHRSDEIPENVLLKDVKNMVGSPTRTIDSSERKAVQNQKTLRIKKSALDLSRAPIKDYPLIPNDDPFAAQYAEHQRQQWLLEQSQIGSSSGHQKIVRPIDVPRNKNPDLKYSEQFQWRAKDFPDDNSVHQRAHPPVLFYENEAEKYRLDQLEKVRLQALRDKEHDSFKDIPQQKYHLLSVAGGGSSVQSSSLGGSVVGGTMTGGATQHSLLLSSRHQQSQSQSQQFQQQYHSFSQQSLKSQSSSSLMGGGSEAILSMNDSANAVRSNYLANDSMNSDKDIPLQLIRMRKVRNLKNTHLKNPLHFVSLQQKEEMDKKKKEQKSLQYNLDPNNPFMNERKERRVSLMSFG
jgi:hypothetical protein